MWRGKGVETHASTAWSREGDLPPPRDMFATLPLCLESFFVASSCALVAADSAAQTTPATTSDIVPDPDKNKATKTSKHRANQRTQSNDSPPAPNTFTAMMVAFLATPYAREAMVPATWDPCPFKSASSSSGMVFPHLARPSSSTCSMLTPLYTDEWDMGSQRPTCW